MSPEADEHGAEAVAAVFGRAASTYDTVIPYFTSFGERLVGAAALARGDRVLDAGCGRGATLLPASVAVGDSGRVVGVDLAEEMVALLGAELEAAGVVNSTVRLGDIEHLDIDDETFDVVLSQMVLHLIPDPPAAAAGFLRVLVPGGRAVASAPSGATGWEFLERVFGKFARRAVRPMALPFRLDFDLPGILSGAGFEIVGDEQVELTLLFPDEQAWWDWGWGNGIRALYEVLAPDDLEGLREEAFAALAAIRTPEGIRFAQRARIVTGAKLQA